MNTRWIRNIKASRLAVFVLDLGKPMFTSASDCKNALCGPVRARTSPHAFLLSNSDLLCTLPAIATRLWRPGRCTGRNFCSMPASRAERVGGDFLEYESVLFFK